MSNSTEPPAAEAQASERTVSIDLRDKPKPVVASTTCGTDMSSPTEAPGATDQPLSSSDDRDETIALLAEQAPIYGGLSTAAAEVVRSRILAGLTIRTDRDAAFAAALEDLQTSVNPRVVAAAAHALRDLQSVSTVVVSTFGEAIERMRHADDYVYLHSTGAPTTAVSELLSTLRAFGHSACGALESLRTLASCEPRVLSTEIQKNVLQTIDVLKGAQKAQPAPCCCATAPPPSPPATDVRRVTFPSMALQDQDGQFVDADVFLRGRPSMIAFFYTRCMNPSKCSSTISKLARVADRLRDEGREPHVSVAAITYDPAFDSPDRLRIYGSNRGLAFSERVRMFRTVESLDGLREALSLNVGYGATTVNQHGRETFVFNAAMELEVKYCRINWDVSDVVEDLSKLSAA